MCVLWAQSWFLRKERPPPNWTIQPRHFSTLRISLCCVNPSIDSILTFQFSFQQFSFPLPLTSNQLPYHQKTRTHLSSTMAPQDRLAQVSSHLNYPKGLLAGQTAIITGSGQGIGAECARLFANEGAKVVVCDVDASTLSRPHSPPFPEPPQRSLKTNTHSHPYRKG